MVTKVHLRTVRTVLVTSPQLTDASLYGLAEQVGSILLASQRSITTAESCTGGFVAKCLTDIAGSSGWFNESVVTYSNASKTARLGVSPRMLRLEGAVSEAVARAMCSGARRHAQADVAIAVTGIAGPGGGSKDKPIGTVWFGWAIKQGGSTTVVTQRRRFTGGRDAVRRKSVREALLGVLRLIQ